MIITAKAIICNDSSNSFYEDGAIYIKDNIIEDVGNREEILKKYPNEVGVDKSD